MKRGRLRVYLGYAAGVGKTFAMLGEGHRRNERGTDVVIGYFEPHERPKTIALAQDLETIPRRSIEYAGRTFEEMDVGAIISRAPEVALVDELAHTNVPGSRNEKRWQDVEELLEAGITVITTLNLQHIESLNDVVERITGVRQQETIPDDVVRRADQIELVDMSPWSLRRRMAHGNVYPPEKIDAALANYFREGNLTALRELALLWVADRVDESLQGYMEEHGIQAPWETRERVVVAVSGGADGERLIRRGARVARRRNGELLAVHVATGDAVPDETRERLARFRDLVADVGGTFHEVAGADVATAILDVARAENATLIILGASSRPRWSELLRGSVINRLIRGSGPIDVHVISGETSDRPSGMPIRRAPGPSIPVRRRLVALALTVAGLPLVTAALVPLRAEIGFASVLLVYLCLVAAIAAIGGWWPALAAVVGASLLANFYFTEPIHTFTIADPENVLAIVVFLVIAALISGLVHVATLRRAQAEAARTEGETLARLAGSVLRDADPLPQLLEQLRTTFNLGGVAIIRREGNHWHTEAVSGTPPARGPSSEVDSFTLADDTRLLLDRSLPAEDRRVLSAFAASLAMVARSRHLEEQAAGAAEVAEVNELRAAILAAVSHDLRTPLASIKASVSSLRQEDVEWSPEQTSEFLEAIEDQTDRLNALVGNLLDMSRVQTGALDLVSRAVGLDEVVPAALASVADDAVRIEVDVPESLHRVRADPALLERAVANLVSNAVAWSPPERPVRVQASEHGGRVELRVVDRGPGIPAEDRGRVFEPFQRLGDRSNGGVGLGLAVAKGFVDAMGGNLSIEDTPGGGLTAIVSLEAAP